MLSSADKVAAAAFTPATARCLQRYNRHCRCHRPLRFHNCCRCLHHCLDRTDAATTTLLMALVSTTSITARFAVTPIIALKYTIAVIYTFTYTFIWNKSHKCSFLRNESLTKKTIDRKHLDMIASYGEPAWHTPKYL